MKVWIATLLWIVVAASASASTITKWMNPGATTKFGATYKSLNPTTLAENDNLSGTKVEAEIALVVEQGGPDSPTWKSKQFKIEWLNHTVAPTIHERLAEAGECPAFKFRYATTLVDHGTDLQFRVTGKVSWRKENQVDIWEDVDITFTFKAYNLLNITTTNRDGAGNVQTVLDTNANQFFDFGKAMLDPSHLVEPGTSLAAKSRDFAEIVATIMPSTIFLATLHGSLNSVKDSYVNDTVYFLNDIAPEVADKPSEEPHPIPHYNLVMFYSCQTISQVTGASVAAAAFEVNEGDNRTYFGFSTSVSALCYTASEWAIVQKEIENGEEISISPSTPLAKHLETLLDELQKGSTSSDAAKVANNTYITIYADPTQDPPLIPSPITLIGDPQTRLKYVYLSKQEENLLSSTPNSNLKVWWVKLPVSL